MLEESRKNVILKSIKLFQVSSDDSLPQFICEHCLLYLKHAYEVRQRIISNTANLRKAAEIASSNSIHLESHINQSRITSREVEEWNDEEKEATYFYTQFNGADIKINQSSKTKHTERAIEQKCPSCQKRVMSIKSLNDHMDICAISILDTFFGQFKSIYSKRLSTRLTSHEFILHSIKLVFDTQKKLQAIVGDKLDVNSITSEIPIEEVSSFFPHKLTLNHNSKNRQYQSPDHDFGYVSGGGNCNYAPR